VYLYLLHPLTSFFSIFFFYHPSTTHIYTLSLHDALPISKEKAPKPPKEDGRLKQMYRVFQMTRRYDPNSVWWMAGAFAIPVILRSEEHTSELQSRENLVCRLLLEKKK